ncbi:hypothetical protein B5807_05409 [Epicoccum nigrum]|uniref:Uncharacterized protein n=1 Tax=Epicoccum nigrum TaxID=105696 RepID=A0A1Y2LZ46_EPING|nr:hypothetical protein B5807_05409 [Epicoccum nigrum]
MYQDLQEIRGGVPKTVLTIGQKQAQALYVSVTRRFAQKCCKSYLDSCQPRLGRQKEPDLAGKRKFFINCASYHPNTNQSHFFQWVKKEVDVGYLADLFYNGLPSPENGGIEPERCNVIEPMTGNLRTYGK